MLLSGVQAWAGFTAAYRWRASLTAAAAAAALVMAGHFPIPPLVYLALTPFFLLPALIYGYAFK